MRHCLWLLLVVACSRPLKPLADPDNVATLSLTWAPTSVAAVDFAARALAVSFEVKDATTNATLRDGTLAASEPGVTVAGVPGGARLRVTVAVSDADGTVIYRGEQVSDPLPPSQVSTLAIPLNGLPAAQFIETRGVAGDIEVTFNLQDPDGDTCDLELQYRGGKNIALYARANVDTTQRLALAANQTHQLVWHSNAESDEFNRVAIVQLRLIPRDRHSGFPSESAQMQIDNRRAEPTVPSVKDQLLVTSEVTPELCWTDESASGAVRYRFELYSGNSSSAMLATETEDTCVRTDPLSAGSYRYRVAAIALLGNDSGFSPERQFEIDVTPPGTPTLPPVQTPARANVVSFNWTDVLDATCDALDDGRCAMRYRFVLSTDSTFQSNTVVDTTLGQTNFAWTPPANGGTFFYRVAAIDAGGLTSAFSSTETLVIDAVEPATPLVQAFSPSVTSDVTPTLHFTQVGVDVIGFRVEVARSVAFAATDMEVDAIFPTSPTGPVTEWTVPNSEALSGVPRQAYFFRLRAIDSAGNESAPTLPVTLVVDEEPPPTPSQCAIVSQQCFAGCQYLATHTPLIDAQTSVPIGDEKYVLELELWRDGLTLTETFTTPVSSTNERFTAALPSLNNGSYQMRLYTRDDAGLRSPAFANCGGGSSVLFDFTPPPAPTLLGSVVYAGDQTNGSGQSGGSVKPTLFFQPGSTLGAGEAPVVGYYFELKNDGDPTLNRCAFAQAGSSNSTAVTDCTLAYGSAVTYECPSGEPCEIRAAAELAAADDRKYRLTLVAVDAAGNRSAAAQLGPQLGSLPANELYADATLPQAAEPLSPAGCGGQPEDDVMLDHRALGGNRVPFSWAQAPGAARYILDIVARPRDDSDCSSQDHACRADIRCSNDSEEQCTVCSAIGATINVECSSTLADVCLRPAPNGECEAEYLVHQGWYCIGSDCRYRVLVEGDDATVTMLNTGNGFGGTRRGRWSIIAVDAAGNQKRDRPNELDTQSDFTCNAFDHKRTGFRLDMAPPFAAPYGQATDFDLAFPDGSRDTPTLLDDAHPSLYWKGIGMEISSTFEIEVQSFDDTVFPPTPVDVVYTASMGCGQTQMCNCTSTSEHTCNFNELSHTVSSSLPDGLYRWRVRARDTYDNVTGWLPCSLSSSDGWSDGLQLCDDWSNTMTMSGGYFNISGGGGGGGSATPQIIWPVQGAVCSGFSLRWLGNGATSYTIEVKKVSDGSGTETIHSGSGSDPQVYAGLGAMLSSSNTWYYARVRPTADTFNWSDPVVFKWDTAAADCSTP